MKTEHIQGLFNVLLIVALLLLGGWIANIVKLVGIVGGEITGMLVARAAGIFIPPLGGVLGYF